MTQKLDLYDIINLCQCEVSIEVDSYTTNYLSFQEGLTECVEEYDVPDLVIQEMRFTGHIVRVQAYPRTPAGFEYVYGGTVDFAIERMYALLTKEETE